MTVSHSGRGWRLAPSLVALEAEADRLAPRRSRASDGSIGDQAHRRRKSDHNPAGGYVHGLDLTHDPAGGFDAHAHARAVALRADPRIEYIISDGRIWERETKRWKRYTGQNPHRHHAHFSIRHTSQARNDIGAWLTGVPHPTPQPPVVAPTPAPVPQPPTFTPIEEDDDMIVFQQVSGNDRQAVLQHGGELWPLTGEELAFYVDRLRTRRELLNAREWDLMRSNTRNGDRFPWRP